MLTRLYADNFRCLVNFEFRPQPVQLLMGRNATGKSSVLDLLTLVRAFVEGEGRTEELSSDRGRPNTLLRSCRTATARCW